jgi:hypothetical protein
MKVIFRVKGETATGEHIPTGHRHFETYEEAQKELEKYPTGLYQIEKVFVVFNVVKDNETAQETDKFSGMDKKKLLRQYILGLLSEKYGAAAPSIASDIMAFGNTLNIFK